MGETNCAVRGPANCAAVTGLHLTGAGSSAPAACLGGRHRRRGGPEAPEAGTPIPVCLPAPGLSAPDARHKLHACQAAPHPSDVSPGELLAPTTPRFLPEATALHAVTLHPLMPTLRTPRSSSSLLLPLFPPPPPPPLGTPDFLSTYLETDSLKTPWNGTG